MTENATKKNWFRIFSPAILGIILSVIGVIDSYIELNSSGGWSYLGIIILVPVIAILLGFDVLVKLIFKDKTLLIWVMELLTLGLIYWFWISKFVR